MQTKIKKILLADDDSSVREAIGRVLESEHYEVVPASSGREAARKFVSELPDLVLLDLNMPDRDGWEAYDLMNQTHPLVPIIVITARPQQYGVAADRGADALMEKPLDLRLLLDTIAKFLGESEPERVRRLTDPEFKTILLDTRPRGGRYESPRRND
jgi:DNA-binding response OmpR family regulator